MPLLGKLLLSSLLVAGATSFFTYPRLTTKLHRFLAQRQATAVTASLATTLHEGDLIFHTS
ncbi:MAG: hypothetical protein EOO61_21380, partial [Hymenobacter sp.]